MTNAEKYVRDEASAREFREKLAQFIFGELGFYDGTEEAIDEVIGDFLDMIEKPVLSEDERVILRNIKNSDFDKYIGRGDCRIENTPINYNLYLRGDDECKAYAIGTIYNHLFQFIKNGEEYEIRELLKR